MQHTEVQTGESVFDKTAFDERFRSMLTGLNGSYYELKALNIWDNLLGIQRLPERKVWERASAIHELTREILFDEAAGVEPFTLEVRNELASLFRHAAFTIAASTSDPEAMLSFSAPILDRAREIETGRPRGREAKS